MADKRLTLHYSGQVQGVGFRFAAERFARDYHLSGYVRNMPDGRVELLVEGEEKTVEGFLQALNEDMGNYIENYSVNWAAATGEYKNFSIRY